MARSSDGHVWLRVEEYDGGVHDSVEQVPELDLAAMAADMLPPTADDVPLALDGTPLDTPAKLLAYLDEINARRLAGALRAD